MNVDGGASHSVTLSYGVGASGTELALELLDAELNVVAVGYSNAISLDGIVAGAYYIRVHANDAATATFVSDYSITITAPYVPLIKSAPTWSTPDSVTTSDISLVWTPTPGALSYQLERSFDAISWSTLVSALDETRYTDYSLDSNTTYYYRVSARYANDDSLYTSTPIAIRTLIPDDSLLPNNSPSAVDVQPLYLANGGNLGALSIAVYYDKLALPAGDEDWFAFNLTSYRAEGSITAQFAADGDPLALQLYNASNQVVRNASLTGAELTLSLSGLAPGRYYARIYAAANACNPEYSLAFVPGSPVLNAPTSLTATLLTTNAIALAWLGDGGAEFYEIQRAPVSAPTNDDWTTIASGVANTNYVDSTVLGSVTYSYRVREYREGVYSDFTTSAAVTTNRTKPATPTGVYAERFDNAYAIVTWDPVPGAKNYTVQRSANNGKTWANFSPTTSTSLTDTTFIKSVNWEPLKTGLKLRR